MSSQHTSPNLLTLITKSSKKLTEFSKRSQPSDTFHLSGFQSVHQKKSNPTVQPTKQQQEEEMNSLYQQNQKLGYRINYLNDENNFFRISINNIQKLNNKIHKDLDGHQERAMDSHTKKKITTKPSPNLNSGANSIASLKNPKTTPPSDTLPQATVQPSSSISSSFSVISNKIHLKNLQMKVGNSIRKTQKLKKIYEGSISSLNKKAEQLELEVNKLARQAEYYQIEEELLNNIYKADYYLNLNQEWIDAGNKAGMSKESPRENLRQDNIRKHHTDDNFDIEENPDSDQEYRDYFKKDLEALDKLKKPSTTTQHPKSTKKFKQSNSQAQFQVSKSPQLTADTFPNAIRFLSGSYHQRQNSTFKNTWYSTLYQKPPTSGKPSMESFHLTATLPKDSVTGKDFNSKVDSVAEDGQKHMTEMEMFLLPGEMIEYIIGSLEKEEIQQLNKLESLRKEEKEQRKMNGELVEGVRRLEGEKVRLKQLIEEEFAEFLSNNLNRMQTMASNTLPKRPSLPHPGRRPHPTLYPTPHPTPLTSIHQRKLQADQLYLCNLYQRQLLESIQKQDKLLEDQYKLNQQYKQKIIDRNEQENKELKVLEEEVNKCIEQVKEIKQKYKSICLAKGKVVKEGSVGNVKSRQLIGYQQGLLGGTRQQDAL